MNEDFVSFDLAKKLKEKGFPQYTEKSYFVGDHVKRMCSVGTFLYTHTQNASNLIAAPTISQVLKWLRMEKDIFVNIDCSCNDSFDFFFTIYKKGEETWEVCVFNDDWYKSPEQAALAGIEYVLNNLI